MIIHLSHPFRKFGWSETQPYSLRYLPLQKKLPLKSEWGELKGDHHQNALLITVNVDYSIERPQDIFFALERVTE